jgi:tetratricopeptide (TPR) repeat protein
MTTRTPNDDAPRQQTAVPSPATEIFFAHQRWFLALVLVVITFAAYQPVRHAGFIWDDDAYVTQNPLLTAPDGLQRIWFSAHHQSQYFPLVFTTLRFERMLWGLHPVGYHFVNLLLHGLNALLLWVVLRKLAVPGSWLAAAIWAVHPVNVESVAWITELKNTQSTLFYLLALLAWMKFTARETGHPWRFYLLALVLQTLALFSKTTACTLPVALLLVLWLQKRPIGGRRLIQVAPFLALGVAMGLLSVSWEAHLGNYGRDLHYPFHGLERLLIATHAVWFYVTKLVWPTKLAFSYPRWEIDRRDPLQYAGLIGCVAIALWLWWRRRALGRAPVAAVVFFVASLSPLLGFIPLYTFRYAFVADHYQYVASIGLIALFAAAVSSRADTCQLGRTRQCALSVLLLFALGTLTWRQAHIYRDVETLWRDTLAKHPDVWLAHNNLGNVFLQEGKISDAIGHYEQALRSQPDFIEAHNGLGNALFRQGRFPEAIEHWQQALRINPDYLDAHLNLGAALRQAGKSEEAIAHYEQALRIKPDFAEAHNNLGNVFLQEGKISDAIGHYEQALRLKPDYAEAHANLGNALAQVGRVPEAIVQYQQALRIQPDFTPVQQALARLQARQ